jgi:hypothetical protein
LHHIGRESMETNPHGRQFDMNRHFIRGFWLASIGLIVFACLAIGTNAQNILQNPGFETASTNLIYYPDANGVIITNQSAANWTVFQQQNTPTEPTNALSLAFRTANTGPQSGTYTEPDFSYQYFGVNNSGSATTALTGNYALQTFGPFTNFCCGAAGVSQWITSGTVPAISNNSIWVLSANALNWSVNQMQNIGPGVTQFGSLLIQFYDANTNWLGQYENAQLGTNMPVDVWTNISVTGTAPEGTTQIRAIVQHVGMSGALGSILWDDLSLTNAGVAPPPPPPPVVATNAATILAGNQLCWPTVVNTSYQPQYSDDNSTWVNVIATNAPQQLLPGNGATNCIFAASHKFYRVVQTPATPVSLLNTGFESPVTATNQADNWVQFNGAVRTATNATLFGITAHSGAYSMQTFGPFGVGLDAAGAYQDLAASPGSAWRLTGYCLNWQNDLLLGSNAFGRADIEFLDATGTNVLLTVPGPAFGQNTAFPLDAWQFFEVDGTAPGGTATVRIRVAHFGEAGETGSAWWDDLTLSQPTGGSSTITPSVSPAVQLAWATPTPNSTFYQAQSITNLVFTNLPPVNVLSNAGFEANAVTGAVDTATVTGWSLAASGGGIFTSSSPFPTHSGIGALRMTAAGGAVPVAWQIFPASPGQIWDFQGYLLQTNSAPLVGAAFALLKIVWLDATSATLQPMAGDTNAIGTIVTGTYAGIESAHVTAGSPQNSWIFSEARGTAPPGCTQVQVLPILVAGGGSGTIRFDDLSTFQPVSFAGWKNLGPVFPANGNTISIFDPIAGKPQNFYRVISP